MALEHKPFVSRKDQAEREAQKGRTIGVWFNDEELADLRRYGVFLHQEKPATIIKQMLGIAANLIDEPRAVALRDLLFNNVRKNRRLGIEIVEPKISKS